MQKLIIKRCDNNFLVIWSVRNQLLSFPLPRENKLRNTYIKDVHEKFTKRAHLKARANVSFAL